MKKSAFTLAEVLITLGIIGVVAALTIPTLLQKNYERKTVAQLKETQSILAQAIRMAEEEYGDVEGWVEEKDWTTENAITVAEKLKPFLKLSLDCGVLDEEGKCFRNETYKQKNGNNYMNVSLDERVYKMALLNGSSFTVAPYPDRITPIVTLVDTNGQAPPNTMGRDLFLFRYENYSLKPGGAPDSTYPYETACKLEDSSGYGCAYYVINNQSMDYLH